MSGLIILPIFIFYVIVGFLLIKFILKIFKKKFSNILLLLIVILLPFWDLLFQLGIRSFYQVFLLNPIVYEMPQKDNAGKIESIGKSLTFHMSIDDIRNEQRLAYRLNKRYPNLKEKVSTFIELKSRIGRYEDKTNKNIIVKVFMRNNNYEIIDKTEARYIVKRNENVDDTHFLGYVIGKTFIQIYDTQKDIVIAETLVMGVSGIKFMEYIRRKYFLMYVGPRERKMFSVRGAGYADRMIDEVFKIEGL